MKFSQVHIVSAIFGELDRQMKEAGVPEEKRVLSARQMNGVIKGVDAILEGIDRPDIASVPGSGLQAWLNSDDTGASSKAMAARLFGLPIRPSDSTCHPWDPSDFGRCHRFLEAVPDARPRLQEVAGLSPVWARLIAAWDELTALYLQELPSGRCPLLYKRMQELIGK